MINNIKEFCSSIFQSSSERMKSPIIGTYVLSFIIVNWRPFVVLIFSNSTIENRVKLIDATWCNSKAMWIPGIITVIYIFIIPYAHLLIDKFLSWYRKYEVVKEHEARKTLLINQASEAALERQVADAKAGTSEINDLQEKVQVLTTQNQILSSQSTAQIENHNRTLEENKNQIRQLNEELTSKTKELEKYSSRHMVEVPEEVRSYFNKLDWTGRSNYMKFVDFYIHKSISRVSTEVDDYIPKYLEYGFIKKGNSSYELTLLGKLFYQYCVDNDDIPF